MTKISTGYVQGDTEDLKLIHPGWTILLNVFAAVAVIGFGLAGIPDGHGSMDAIKYGLNGARTLAEESGLTLIGIAISLVAIAITTMAILGISDPDPGHERRRFSIMRIAELLLFTSLLFLMGCVVASVLGFAALIWEAEGEVVNSAGNSVTFMGGVALFLWFGVDLIRKQIVEVYTSDALAMRLKKEGLQNQIDQYRKVLKKVNSSLWEGQKDSRYGIIWSIKRALLVTFLLFSLGALASVVIYCTQNSDVPLGEKLPASMSISMMILLLQVICAAFTVLPFLWAASYWNFDVSGFARSIKEWAFILLSTSFLIVYSLGIFSAFTVDTDISPLTAIGLLAAIVIPVLISFVFGGAKSWHSVSKHHASIRLKRTIDQLVEKLESLDACQDQNLPTNIARWWLDFRGPGS